MNWAPNWPTLSGITWRAEEKDRLLEPAPAMNSLALSISPCKFGMDRRKARIEVWNGEPNESAFGIPAGGNAGPEWPGTDFSLTRPRAGEAESHRRDRGG